MNFASKGSQRWLQIAVNNSPTSLDRALHQCGALKADDSVEWRSPLKSDGFKEYHDKKALRQLGIAQLQNCSLCAFWPKRGPHWDALGISRSGSLVLVEAKAHISEIKSSGTRAKSLESLELIRESLLAARRYYAPRAKVDWSSTFYQYTNRLAFQFLLRELNNLDSMLIFLCFTNADDVCGPKFDTEWRSNTRFIHAQLGLPEDLSKFGIFHIYFDVSKIKQLI